MDITLLMYLVPSLVMFGCGVFGFITRKNMIAILISACDRLLFSFKCDYFILFDFEYSSVAVY